MAVRKDDILDAAIAIADEHGLDAVSMRGIAQRVGVTPMALYPHIGSKTALQDAMYGRIIGELLPGVPAGGTWQERLRNLAHSARDLARSRPWVVTLMLARPAVTPDAVQVTHFIQEALREAGVPGPEVPRLERLLGTFMLGYMASESGGRFGAGTHLDRAARDARWRERALEWEAEFDADMDDFAEMIRARARGRQDPAG